VQSLRVATNSLKVATPLKIQSSGKRKTAHVAASALKIARERGLLQGARVRTIRGRMPEELVAQAKRRTGIASDSKLIETALAHLAVADDYVDWLISQRGTIGPELDLEF
jgi:hypothetical protein